MRAAEMMKKSIKAKASKRRSKVIIGFGVGLMFW